MNAILTIDGAGRLVIPKPVRDELGIVKGDRLELSSDGVQLVIRPARPAPTLRKERGFWIHEGGPKLTLDQANSVIEKARMRADPSRERR